MPRHLSRALAAAVAALALIVCPAGAQPGSDCTTVSGNLVQNCGFEGPTYLVDYLQRPSGYAVTGNDGGGAAVVTTNARAHSGANAFAFADDDPASATLSQTLATTPGTVYQISFWAFDLGGNAAPRNRLAVTFGGETVFSSALVNGLYQQFTAVGVATGANTVLAFTGYNTSSSTHLDDLSVTALAVTAPEPATLGLCGAGLLVVGGVAHRRSRAKA